MDALDLTSARLPADRTPALVYLASLGSKQSRRSMRSGLDAVAKLLGAESFAAVPWHLLRYQHVAAVRTALAERYPPATANHHLTAVRMVARHSYNLGLMAHDDYLRICNVEGVKGSRVRPGRAISPGEMRALFEAASGRSGAWGVRDTALLGVLYGGGLRRSELLALNLDSYDPTERVMRVLGKGNKERLVPLPIGSAAALEAWLQYRGYDPGPLWLFVDRSGTILPRRRCGEKLLTRLLARLETKASLDHFTSHDFRRTMISDALDAGADLTAASRLVGHSDPATTASYDRRDERALRKVSDMLHVPFVPKGR